MINPCRSRASAAADSGQARIAVICSIFVLYSVLHGIASFDDSLFSQKAMNCAADELNRAVVAPIFIEPSARPHSVTRKRRRSSIPGGRVPSPLPENGLAGGLLTLRYPDKASGQRSIIGNTMLGT